MVDRLRFIVFPALVVLCSACASSASESPSPPDLPMMTLAVDVDLIASPSHASSYLGTETVKAGETVDVIGRDTSSAYLLVVHGDEVGWVPSILSRDNIGNLIPQIVVDPLPPSCTKYVDAVFDPEQEWASTIEGNMLVAGSILRPQVEAGFDATTLTLEIDSRGVVGASDYINVPLTQQSAIVLFAFVLEGLERDSTVRFDVTKSNAELIHFQAALFTNECDDAFPSVHRLPVGVPKSISDESNFASAPTDEDEPVAMTPEPVIIEMVSGAPNTELIGGASLTTRLPRAGANIASIWERAAFRDLLAPGRRSYDVDVRPGEELRWSFEWCAIDEATLNSIVQPLRVDFLVDGALVPYSSIQLERKERSNGWACDTWSTLLTNWPRERTIELDVHYSLAQGINDGQNSYPAGGYHQVIYATVR